jgi:glycosyltransferase involved in cell wall biosynthesis
MPPTMADYLARVAPAGCCGQLRWARATAFERTGLVTVVTIAFNSDRTLEKTIDSVAAQTYSKVQHIIVDGGSTDGTLEVLERRAKQIDLYISETDGGISDAFNKGIALAAGEYVALVNSDDWLEPSHLAMAVDALEREQVDFVFGDIMFHPTAAGPTHVIRGERGYGRRLRNALPHLNHPTVLCRRKVYEEFGLYDLRLRVAMDYEWFLRGYQRGVTGLYVPDLMSHMSMGGVSHRQYSAGLREVCEVSIRYGYPAVLARLRYRARILKVGARVALLRILPRGIYERLRRMINPHYEGAEDRSA